MSEIEFKAKAEFFFHNLEFEEAIIFYEKALSVQGSNEIILNSNLSACYFELGKSFVLTFFIK